MTAESPYERGLRLLTELLSRKELIPEPTVASLRKYFPPVCGVLPRGLEEEAAALWQGRLEYYADLVGRFGLSSTVPRQLLRAVRAWEHLECCRVMSMPGPPAKWHQDASREWTRIRHASRERRVRRPKRSLRAAAPRPRPASSRVKTDELAKLWAPADPALVSQALAVEPEYLQERLQDPAYQQRYDRRLGETGDSRDDEHDLGDDQASPEELDEGDAPDVQPPPAEPATRVQIVGSAVFVAAVTRILAADTSGILSREPEYLPLPSWAIA